MDNLDRNLEFNKYENLIQYCISRYFNDYMEKEDLYQTGAVQLLKAIDKYDESNNVNFETYAKHTIVYGMLDYINQETIHTKINHNAINKIVTCIKNGTENNLSMDEIYKNCQEDSSIPDLDMNSFRYLYNNFCNNYYELTECDMDNGIPFVDIILDNVCSDEIYDKCLNIINNAKVKQSNKDICIDYLNSILDDDNKRGIYSALSLKYGISRERVRQIINKMHKIISDKLAREI